MNHNILLVEDDLKLNELIKNYFASYNYRVFQAENNSEAEEILAKEKIHSNPIDKNSNKTKSNSLIKDIKKIFVKTEIRIFVNILSGLFLFNTIAPTPSTFYKKIFFIVFNFLSQPTY